MITTIGPAKLCSGYGGNVYVGVSPWLFNNLRKEHNNISYIRVCDELCVLTDIPFHIAPYYSGMSLSFTYIRDVCDPNIYKLSLCNWKPYTDKKSINLDNKYYDALKSIREYGRRNSMFDIKNVIHHDPATIVYWCDGTKTVVKCGENDIYDPEKGLAMAIAKKVFGNKGNYYNQFKKWLPKEETNTSDNQADEQAEYIKKSDVIINKNPNDSENTWGF